MRLWDAVEVEAAAMAWWYCGGLWTGESGGEGRVARISSSLPGGVTWGRYQCSTAFSRSHSAWYAILEKYLEGSGTRLNFGSYRNTEKLSAANVVCESQLRHIGQTGRAPVPTFQFYIHTFTHTLGLLRDDIIAPALHCRQWQHSKPTEPSYEQPASHSPQTPLCYMPHEHKRAMALTLYAVLTRVVQKL
jgi:hypothetical protein